MAQTIEDQYRQKFPTSSRLHDEARGVLPGGVTHDARHLTPFPVYVDHAAGSRKWDVDGNELIDYWIGHGALILGHAYPDVVEAVTTQMARGTHYGACHELEVEWAKRIVDLIPSAEKVRFVCSGTEATLMALRLARVVTGKRKVVKFECHFHGWQDYLAGGVQAPRDLPAPPGVLDDVARATIVLPPNDIGAVVATLDADEDIACVILEPTGGGFGIVPTKPGFLQSLREATAARGVLLVFDEVITGFRCSPGGAQAYFDVLPDLTALAKIMGGGLPAGAVAGPDSVMCHLAFGGGLGGAPHVKIPHQGTYNANPLTASAGITTLDLVADGQKIAAANRMAQQIRDRCNEVIARHDVKWCVYGDFSGFKVLIDHECDHFQNCDRCICNYSHRKLRVQDPNQLRSFRRGMLLNGVDLPAARGMTSCVHTDEDLDATVGAFEQTLTLMKREGIA